MDWVGGVLIVLGLILIGAIVKLVIETRKDMKWKKTPKKKKVYTKKKVPQQENNVWFKIIIWIIILLIAFNLGSNKSDLEDCERKVDRLEDDKKTLQREVNNLEDDIRGLKYGSFFLPLIEN